MKTVYFISYIAAFPTAFCSCEGNGKLYPGLPRQRLQRQQDPEHTGNDLNKK